MGDLRTLLRYFRPYRTSLIIGIACIMAGVAFNVTIPLIVGNAIDANWQEVRWQNLTIASLKVFGLSVMSGLFLFLQRRILIGLSRHIEYDLRNDFYAAMVNQPQSFFHGHRTGDLMARATNDLSAVRQMVGPMIMYGLQTLFVVIVIVPIIFAISWKLTLLLFVTMPLVSLTVKYFGQQVHTRFQQIQDFFAQITARAQENFTGVRVVRAYAQEQIAHHLRGVVGRLLGVGHHGAIDKAPVGDRRSGTLTARRERRRKRRRPPIPRANNRPVAHRVHRWRFTSAMRTCCSAASSTRRRSGGPSTPAAGSARRSEPSRSATRLRAT